MGVYFRLIDFDSQDKKEQAFLTALENDDKKIKFNTDWSNFSKIPGSPIAYWVSKTLIDHIVNAPKVGTSGEAKQGLITSDNDRFLRFWYEVDTNKINIKWFQYVKGGGFRKWYGNIVYVVNWENDGYEICNFYGEDGRLKSRPQNIQFFFLEGLTWNDVSTAKFCCRYVDNTCAFDASGPMLFLKNNSNIYYFLGLLNSSTTQQFLDLICQGLHYSTGHIPQIPSIEKRNLMVEKLTKNNVSISRNEWDSYETSSGFKKHPLV